MTSAKLILAARTNGRKSRGPKTPEGKQKSAANSTRHGVYAKTPQFDDLAKIEFDLRIAGFTAEFQPATPRDTRLVEEMAFPMTREFWAIRTVTNIINGYLTDHPGALAFDAHSTYRAAIDRLARLEKRSARQFRTALYALLRNRNGRNEPDSAAPGRNPEMAKRAERTEIPPLAGDIHETPLPNVIPDVPHTQANCVRK